MTTQGTRARAPIVIPFIALLVVAMLLGTSFRASAAPYAAMVMDARSGEVLHARNADTRLHPASLTKMMTLYIAFEAVRKGEISLDTKVKISKKAAAEPPSKLGLKAGQRIALRYLIRAAAVKSANDAATAIGEAISGSEAAFARRMNRTAKALGMTRTTFKNAHGLTETGHLSTARDMTILGRRVLYDYPQYYNLFSRRTTSAGVRDVANTNRRLLGSYKGADGIKTGYTRAAGFNLVASAERGRERVIATVFGGRSSASRNAKVAELLDLGFKRAPTRVAVKKPALPNYASIPADGSAPAKGAAGKTIRVLLAVKTSPRPIPRPAPEAPAEKPLLLAMQSEIEQAVAEAATAPVADSPVGAEAVEKAIEIASANAGEETVQQPADTGLTGSDQPDGPKPRPQIAPVEGEITVAALPTSPEADRPAPKPKDLTAAAIVAAADAALADKAPTRPEMATRNVAFTPTVPKPRPRVLDFGRASKRTTPLPEPVVITRVSTSGGRHWGINVGRYTTRYKAERVLLKTALAEMATLDGSLRKVVHGKRGFDANFMGMTQDQAALACRRLAARGTECKTLGPG